MSTFHEPFEAVLSTAMERIKDLKRSNQQLIKSLEAATSRAASYQAQLEKVLDLERENQRLAGELETMLSLLTSLKGVVKVALQGMRQEDVQELRKKLEVVYKIISLYELLHGSDQGGDTEVPTLKADVQAPATHQRPERGARGPHREDAEPGNAPEEPLFGDEDATLQALMFGRESTYLGAEPERVGAVEETVVPFASRGSQRRTEEVIVHESVSDTASTEGTELAGPQGAGISLIVSPFSHFDTINKFIAAVRSLPGVTAVTPRHFQKGTLRLLVEYEGVVPLLNHLRDLPQFALQIRSSSAERIEATLEKGEGGALGAFYVK